MLRFVKNFVFFIIFCLFQIFYQGNFFVKPIIDLLLIFLILSFFDFPTIYITILILIRGIIFDSLSGLPWGINLLSLAITFLFGFLLTRFLERENFISRIIIGETMMGSYWLSLYLMSLLIAHQPLGVIMILNFFINSCLYSGFLFFNYYVFAKKNNYQR